MKKLTVLLVIAMAGMSVRTVREFACGMTAMVNEFLKTGVPQYLEICRPRQISGWLEDEIALARRSPDEPALKPG